jgi:hypothetical protein
MKLSAIRQLGRHVVGWSGLASKGEGSLLSGWATGPGSGCSVQSYESRYFLSNFCVNSSCLRQLRYSVLVMLHDIFLLR